MMLNRSGATSVIRTVRWMFLCSTQFVVTDGLNCSISVVGARVAFPTVHVQFAPRLLINQSFLGQFNTFASEALSADSTCSTRDDVAGLGIHVLLFQAVAGLSVETMPDRGRSDTTPATAEDSPSNSHAGPCDTPQQHNCPEVIPAILPIA